MKKIINNTIFTITLISSAANAAVVYQEDFSTGFTAGSLGGQNGWATSIGDGVDVVGTAPALEIKGDGTDGGTENLSLYTISSSTTTITFDVYSRIRKGSAYDQLIDIKGVGGSIFQFGASTNGWRLRSSDGTSFWESNAVGGDEALSTANHRYYDLRVEYDFAAETGTFSAKWEGGDANWTTLKTFTSTELELTAAEKLPENWTGGLSLRLEHSASSYDNIVVNTAVPEPSSAALLGLGSLALILRRRK